MLYSRSDLLKTTLVSLLPMWNWPGDATTSFTSSRLLSDLSPMKSMPGARSEKPSLGLSVLSPIMAPKMKRAKRKSATRAFLRSRVIVAVRGAAAAAAAEKHTELKAAGGEHGSSQCQIHPQDTGIVLQHGGKKRLQSLQLLLNKQNNLIWLPSPQPEGITHSLWRACKTSLLALSQPWCFIPPLEKWKNRFHPSTLPSCLHRKLHPLLTLTDPWLKSPVYLLFSTQKLALAVRLRLIPPSSCCSCSHRHPIFIRGDHTVFLGKLLLLCPTLYKLFF